MWVMPRLGSLHILVDGLAEVVDGLLVALGGGVDDAVFQVVLQDQLAGIVDGGAHRGDLDQHLRAVPALLDHVPHGLQVADGPGQPVQHGLGVLVAVGVAMGMAVLVVMLVGMGDAVGVQVGVIVDLAGGGACMFVIH